MASDVDTVPVVPRGAGYSADEFAGFDYYGVIFAAFIQQGVCGGKSRRTRADDYYIFHLVSIFPFLSNISTFRPT